MKIKNFKIYILLVTVLLTSAKGYSNTKQYIINAIQNKIARYIKQIYNIDRNKISYEIPSFYLPKYKLYDINIVNSEKNNDNIKLTINISNFFNKKEYIPLTIRVKIKRESINFKINNRVKLIYRRGNICIETFGRVLQKIEEFVVVKTDFGKKLRCRIINQETVEVIE